MEHRQHVPHILIRAVSKDEHGHPFMLAHVAFEETSMDIRWGLDNFTYAHLKAAVQTRPYETAPLSEYSFRLLLGYSSESVTTEKCFLKVFKRKIIEKRCFGLLRCSYRHQTKNIPFACSSAFTSNIEWFKSVKGPESIAHLTVEQEGPDFA